MKKEQISILLFEWMELQNGTFTFSFGSRGREAENRKQKKDEGRKIRS